VTSQFSPRTRRPLSLLPFAVTALAFFLLALLGHPVFPFRLLDVAVVAANCFIVARGLRGPRCDRCASICPWRRYRCEWSGGRTEALCRRCLGSLQGVS
jgi:hypothetical protein